jgi:hypothetical protein
LEYPNYLAGWKLIPDKWRRRSGGLAGPPARPDDNGTLPTFRYVLRGSDSRHQAFSVRGTFHEDFFAHLPTIIMKDAFLQLQQADKFTRPYQLQSLLAELEPRNANVTQRLSVEIANRFMDDGVTNREASQHHRRSRNHPLLPDRRSRAAGSTRPKTGFLTCSTGFTWETEHDRRV